MKILVSTSFKGGSGKTTNTFNLAGVLAEDKRVLGIDIDPQCNLTLDCGVNALDLKRLSIKDVYENNRKEQPRPEEVIIKSPIKQLKNFDIIPSNPYIFATDRRINGISGRDNILKNYFKTNREFFEKNYDYIIIDTNASMSIVNCNAFLLADHILLASDTSVNGIFGAILFNELWENEREYLEKENNISALIIGNNDRRTSLAEEVVEFLGKEGIGKIMLKTIVPYTSKIKRAEGMHVPVSVYAPKEEITQIYKQIRKELEERGVL